MLPFCNGEFLRASCRVIVQDGCHVRVLSKTSKEDLNSNQFIKANEKKFRTTHQDILIILILSLSNISKETIDQRLEQRKVNYRSFRWLSSITVQQRKTRILFYPSKFHFAPKFHPTVEQKVNGKNQIEYLRKKFFSFSDDLSREMCENDWWVDTRINDDEREIVSIFFVQSSPRHLHNHVRCKTWM